MLPFSATALFCEDIRYEERGVNSLVGIFPDSIPGALTYPALMPKLAIYVRVNFDPNDDPGSIALVLVRANGEETSISNIDRTLVVRAISEAKRENNPIAAVITRTIMAPFPIREAGRMRVVARVPGKEVLAGTLNVAPSSEPLPSGQSLGPAP